MARRDESDALAAVAGRPHEFERRGHLADRTVRPDGEDDFRVHLVRHPLADGEVVVGLSHVPNITAVFLGETDELLVVFEKVVESGNHVTAAFERVSDVRSPRLVEPPADGCDADDERVHVRNVVHFRDYQRVLYVRNVVGNALSGAFAVENRGDFVIGVA